MSLRSTVLALKSPHNRTSNITCFQLIQIPKSHLCLHCYKMTTFLVKNRHTEKSILLHIKRVLSIKMTTPNLKSVYTCFTNSTLLFFTKTITPPRFLPPRAIVLHYKSNKCNLADNLNSESCLQTKSLLYQIYKIHNINMVKQTRIREFILQFPNVQCFVWPWPHPFRPVVSPRVSFSAPATTSISFVPSTRFMSKMVAKMAAKFQKMQKYKLDGRSIF